MHIHWVLLRLSRIGLNLNDTLPLQRDKIIPHFAVVMVGNFTTRKNADDCEFHFTRSVHDCWRPSAGLCFRSWDIRQGRNVMWFGIGCCAHCPQSTLRTQIPRRYVILVDPVNLLAYLLRTKSHVCLARKGPRTGLGPRAERKDSAQQTAVNLFMTAV